MKLRLRRFWAVSTLLFVTLGTLTAFLAYRDGRCGQRVLAERMPTRDVDFDFSDPPCDPAVKPADAEILVAYLGVGGFLVEWRGSTLVGAPYFTRQSPLEVLNGRIRVDGEAVARETAAFSPQRWNVILSGHAHYDHLADVPELMLRHSPSAQLWTNRSGVNMLHSFGQLGSRIHAVEDSLGAWIRPTGADGRPLPFRFAPLASQHARHIYRSRFAHGEVTEPWITFEDRRARDMMDGQTVAYLIDLLDEDGESVFRIYYNDAAADGGHGYPPAPWIADRAVDLAVLCVPPHWHVDGYPEGVLEATEASFVLAAHYEDFLQPLDEPLRFIRSLTDARLDDFLETVERVAAERAALRPVEPLCGPLAERWAVPLPGEWLGFEAGGRAVLDSTP